MALRNHVLVRFEAADADPSRIDDGTLTFVIAGGGPTGVELAGGLAELFGRVLAPRLPPPRHAPGPASCCSRPPTGCSARSIRRSATTPGARSSSAASRCCSTARSRRSRPHEVVLGRRHAHPDPHDGLGRRASGPTRWPRRSASSSPRAGGSSSADDLPACPATPRCYVIGDLAASPGPTRRARCPRWPRSRSRVPVTRPADRGALPRDEPTDAVPLRRQGHDGHHRPPRRGGRATRRASGCGARSAGWPGWCCTW